MTATRNVYYSAKQMGMIAEFSGGPAPILKVRLDDGRVVEYSSIDDKAPGWDDVQLLGTITLVNGQVPIDRFVSEAAIDAHP